MPRHERADRFRRCRLADAVRDVNGEEVRAREKALHRFEPDMIGIDVPAAGPALGFHRGLRGVEHALRLRADEGVFAIGFVPDRRHVDAVLGEQLKRVKLGLRLMREAVAHAERETFENQHSGAKFGGKRREVQLPATTR